MREIKFRAWDEKNKIMHFDFQFIKSGNTGNDWVIFISDKRDVVEKSIENPFFSQQLKIMQYTGLKDKNNKEIYEGDNYHIQDGEYSQGYFECDLKGTIIFEHGSFGFNSNGCFYCLSEIKSSKGYIFGNIYGSEVIK